MIEFHDVEQRSDVWVSLRCGRVGGSEAIGLTTPARMETLLYKKAAELVTGNIKEVYVNEAMQWGIDHEPEAREAYDPFGDVQEVGYVTNDRYIFGGLSPDGRVSETKYIEIKCPSSESHIKTIIKNEVPSEYKPQLSWYFIMIPSIEVIDYISYDPRVKSYPIHVISVKRDDLSDDIEKLVSNYQEFEKRLVEALKLFE